MGYLRPAFPVIPRPVNHQSNARKQGYKDYEDDHLDRESQESDEADSCFQKGYNESNKDEQTADDR